jgi:hypothetical protein
MRRVVDNIYAQSYNCCRDQAKELVRSVIKNRSIRALLLAVLLMSALALGACGQPGALSVPDLLARAQQLSGQAVTVSGFYVGRNGSPPLAVLTPVVSTLDNGLDAQPAGDAVWLEGFPEATLSALHQPGDAIYGLVRVSGQFDAAGGYGPEGKYQYQIRVASAESIERVRRIEQRVSDAAPGEGKIGLLELMNDPAKLNGQSITTQGYYFWNGIIYVLAEGISTEEDGSSPQPIGKQIWMEGFPPEESGKLTLGPGNPPSYVWGLVEVTGDFKSGGGFGRDGRYSEFLQVTSARALEKTNQ